MFRIHFASPDQPRDDVMERVSEMGALSEWSSASLVALDARDEPHAQQLADYLQQQEDEGHLVFETGKQHSGGTTT